MVLLLSSCDPNADKQVGRNNRIGNTNSNNGSGGSGNVGGVGGAGAANATTDVPIDGGLSILLVAGVAYGVKRARGTKQKA